MILLDTHIWVWWVDGNESLSPEHAREIQNNESGIIGVSAISCWEVAKLVERGRITFDISIDEWLQQALAYPGVRLLELTPDIAVESTRLPGEFHRDPADQIIVATARIYDCLLLTMDDRIKNYPHVRTL
ncbi:MAG: type II toxin-antitoxin system VapC family toxin [Anaerolineales bacterium]|nr:type II toxin-antitoxin system VapC family toxin [Anaerolineales bacterium]